MIAQKREFIVQMIGGHPIRFIEPTAVRKAFVLVKLEEATKFPSEAAAENRALQEMSGGQFIVLETTPPAPAPIAAEPIEKPLGKFAALRQRRLSGPAQGCAKVKVAKGEA